MLSVIIATIVSMIIGGIWFGPKTFYPVMQELMDQSDEMVAKRMERFKPALHFGIVMVGEFTLALMLYGLLQFSDGDFRIILFPIMFVVISNMKTNIFSFLSFKLFFIQEGEKVLSILAMGLIINLMM